jgi:CheY-like chemotaxis protein
MNKPEHLLPLRANQKVILVVDDEPLVPNVARIVLERDGYVILTAADGEEALNLSRTFPGTIHLLLTDVQMPKMGGLQLRDRLRKERPETKALLMSAQVDVPRGQALLRKPFGLYALREQVREILRPSWRKHRHEHGRPRAGTDQGSKD